MWLMSQEEARKEVRRKSERHWARRRPTERGPTGQMNPKFPKSPEVETGPFPYSKNDAF
jgi:hypothetical protein